MHCKTLITVLLILIKSYKYRRIQFFPEFEFCSETGLKHTLTTDAVYNRLIKTAQSIYKYKYRKLGEKYNCI